jgi:hypothetical protein
MMPGPRNIAIRWYRKVFGAPAGSDIREEGLDTVLDGNSAVALSEAGIASHAVLGGSMPSAGADSIWLGEVAHGTNLFGEQAWHWQDDVRLLSCPERISPRRRIC